MADLTERQQQLVDAFGEYVNTSPDNNKFVSSSALTAINYIGTKIPLAEGLIPVDGIITTPLARIPMPETSYIEEVMELASDLFYRRQAQNGIVSVNAMDGMAPVRVARDPYAACDQRMQRWTGLGFA